MQEQFKQWLKQTGKTEATAYNYANAINKISEHYSQNTYKNSDIYAIQDINKLNEIQNDYKTNGKFSEFGKKNNGLYTASLNRYVEFFTQNITSSKVEQNINTNDNELALSLNQNFSYERDLQTSLCLQINTLFPKYKIFGENSEGIEYTINNRRVDVLLEHIETKNLLAIELKSGEADYKVFGQISMYLGLLKEKFPDKEVKGIIIAGSIQDSLKQAVMITDKIKLKTYKMNIELEEA